MDVGDLLKRVQSLLTAGDVAGAEAAAREACRTFPKVSEAHNALGVVLRTRADYPAALAAYQTAIATDVRNARAYNNAGEVQAQMGAHADAVVNYQHAIRVDRNLRPAHRNLATALTRLGRLDDAAQVLRQALQLYPDDKTLLFDMAALEHDRERFAPAIEAYMRYLALDPHHLDVRINYGSALLDAGRHTQALAEFTALLKIAPGHLAVQHGYHETLSRLVPPWHVPMMNEDQRNFAYRDAIRAVVKPGDHVLEIGTGAGLLAMLSAQAGAHKVTTCEMVQVVAAEATRIVAQNGFGDTVTVLPKKSTDIVIGVDMPEQADVMVSEILANDFVGEGVLPSLLDAKARLLKPDARIIPARGSMMGVLVGGDEVRYLLDLGDVCGFDMRTFTKFKPWSQSVPQSIAYDALSADVPLVTYDFHDVQTLKPANGAVNVSVIQAGRCYGVLQWIRINLTDEIVYENHPRTTQSVWNKVLYAFPQPFDVAAGDKVLVQLWHSGSHFYLTGAKASN
ncbi:MAG: tetratricopeptide repeat protein [Rhodospirillaceae bacterium]|nr:tetratricopeptide repeat protein [Rhodospirillaceae bacterium]